MPNRVQVLGTYSILYSVRYAEYFKINFILFFFLLSVEEEKFWPVCCLHCAGCWESSCPGVCSLCCYTPLSDSPRHSPAVSVSQRTWRPPSRSERRSYCTQHTGSGWSPDAAVPGNNKKRAVIKLRELERTKLRGTQTITNTPPCHTGKSCITNRVS